MQERGIDEEYTQCILYSPKIAPKIFHYLTTKYKDDMARLDFYTYENCVFAVNQIRDTYRVVSAWKK